MLKASIAVLGQIIELIEAIPTPDRPWLQRSLKAYLSGSNGGSTAGSKPVQTRFTEPVHAPVQTPFEPGSNDRFEQESLSSFFLQFWSLYPRKQGKQDALRIYQKLKPDPLLQERICKAVLEQKASEQWITENGRFIPLPKTWLNRGSWDDEPQVRIRNEPRFGRTPASVFKRFIERGSSEVQP